MLLEVRPSRESLTSGPAINPELAERWLVAFLRDEIVERRGIERAVIGLSGGVDSAVTAFLCARALGPQNVYAFRMPFRASSAASLSDAQLVVDALGIHVRTIDITAAVEGYLQFEADADARRRGNVMARTRMLVLFDQSAKLNALPVGTGNKTERLLGYSNEQLIERGFDARDVALVRRRVDSTHWKRHLPTTAMLTSTAINEFYLRPVDF